MKQREFTRMTITHECNGVTFENYPVFVQEDDSQYHLWKHEELAEQIASGIHQEIRHAVTVDCNNIQGFVEKEDYEPPTKAELRIMDWLDTLQRD